MLIGFRHWERIKKIMETTMWLMFTAYRLYGCSGRSGWVGILDSGLRSQGFGRMTRKDTWNMAWTL